MFSSELDNTAEIDLIATSCLPCWRLLSLTSCPVILLLSVLIAEIESTQLPSEETVSLSPVGRYCCVSASIRHWLLRLKVLLTGHYDKRDSVTELQWHSPFFYKSKVKENVSLAQITAEAMASCSTFLLVLETIYIPRQKMQSYFLVKSAVFGIKDLMQLNP